MTPSPVSIKTIPTLTSTRFRLPEVSMGLIEVKELLGGYGGGSLHKIVEGLISRVVGLGDANFVA